MNGEQRLIADKFLDELRGLFSKGEALYKMDRRIKLAEMVIAEIPSLKISR